MSGIGGRVPRYVGDGTPRSATHHIWQILPLMIDARTRRVGVMPQPAAEQAEAAARRELVVKARHVAAALRREQQRQARIAAGTDRATIRARRADLGDRRVRINFGAFWPDDTRKPSTVERTRTPGRSR